MAVDVVTETVINRPPEEVAAYAGDPSNAPQWYVNIKSVEWKTPPPMRVRSKLAFVAQFLGRRIAYTYEVVEIVPGRRLVMSTAQGPFPRRPRTPGFSKIAAPFMAAAMRRANRKDLAVLKRLLERMV